MHRYRRLFSYTIIALAAIALPACGVVTTLDDAFSGRLPHDFIVVNTLYTPLEVTMSAGDGSSDYRIVPPRSSSVWNFRDNPDTVRVSARTSGRTTSGAVLGHVLEWGPTTVNVTGRHTAQAPIETGPDTFFLRIHNTSGQPLRDVRVYQNNGYRWDLDVVVPAEVGEYNVGYFSLSGRVTACLTSSCVQWTGITHPVGTSLLKVLNTSTAQPF